jgi:hypothetical protein
VRQQAKGGEGQMCTSRIKRRRTDMHRQAKNKRDRCAPVGQGQEGQICTSRLRIRGMDAHQQAKEEKRDKCAPAG